VCEELIEEVGERCGAEVAPGEGSGSVVGAKLVVVLKEREISEADLADPGLAAIQGVPETCMVGACDLVDVGAGVGSEDQYIVFVSGSFVSDGPVGLAGEEKDEND
jgi:hypothetical protein